MRLDAKNAKFLHVPCICTIKHVKILFTEINHCPAGHDFYVRLGINSLLEDMCLLRRGSFHNIITKRWYWVCWRSGRGHSGHGRTTTTPSWFLRWAGVLRTPSLCCVLISTLCLLSANMMVIFPVFVLTEWTTVPRQVAPTTRFGGLSATIPTTLREEQCISP